MTLLEARDLRIAFSSRGRRARAVDGVNLTIGEGEIVALVGESGCGKTTLARTLLGLVRPESTRPAARSRSPSYRPPPTLTWHATTRRLSGRFREVPLAPPLSANPRKVPGMGDDPGRIAGPARTRLMASAAAAVTVAAGLGVRALAEGDLAKYAGDALYTVLVYALVVLAAPRARPLTAAGVALAISWAVEFLQLSGVPAKLARESGIARLILGSTFNPPDLFWYAAGAAAGLLVHATALGRSRPSPTSI